ncbi:MAG: butyryl-CoA:acetate CoA-transferase, partial [Syntrophomonadaceae bacterium]|nr:butyryl-CoA:acetate CoA-transferase [Syntrophomonadaceae bacterium]
MSRDFSQMYQEKLCLAEKAVQIIESGDWLDYGMFNGKPVACDRALAARKEELKDVKIMAAVTVPPLPEVVTRDPEGEVFSYLDLHFSIVSRIMQQRCGGVYYNPLCYGEAEKYFSDGRVDPDNVGAIVRKAFIVQVTPMDKDGYFNWGAHNSTSYAQAMSARKIIVEVNEKLPLALGGAKERIHISQVDAVVEGENPDLA